MTDNAATITTGSGATTVSGTTSGDTLTINAASLANDTTLTQSGAAQQVVTGLVGDINASALSGTLTVTTGNNSTDNDISIATGTANTTISANGSGDTIAVNADGMLDNTTLDINGSAAFTVSNLEANTDAAGSSGSLTLTYANVTDNVATLLTGTGNVLVSGGDNGDTITVTGLSTNIQTFNAQASTSNFNITAGANNQTITGSNTGSDTIDGGAGSDTLSYAGGSAVDVTLSSYSTYSGGSTGQGTDTFSAIESLVGSSGTDILRGTTSDTDEVATITAANSGTIRDSASTGTFSFSAFEQLDLQGGNDTLNITGSSSGVSLSGSVDLGSGNNTLSMSGSAGSIASLSSGNGNDTFTISGGSITGALTASDGTNALTISGTSSSIGSYAGGTGSDSLTLSGGDVGGDVDLGTGTNTLLISSTSSTVGGDVSFGAGTADTLSYAGYGNTVSVELNSISSNSGTTTSGGATAITGMASGFETVVGGSSSGDTLTDSSGDSSVSVTGANSGTLDGLTFSSFENLSLSTGNDTVTVNGSGSGVSLTGSLDLGDGTNSLTMNGSAGSIASVTSGTGDDTVSISAGSVTGAVTAGNGTNSITISGTSSSIGSYTSGTGGDSVTLSGGDVVGNVSTGTGTDTVLISSTSSTIGGNLDLGSGDSDTLSYADYSNAVSVTLSAISSNSGSTAAGGATAIAGTASGFENLIGGSNSGDTITDSTGDSTIVISGANSGTIDGMTFSAIENLSLSTGIDGVTVSTGGSLSGTLNLGDGTSNTLVMNSGAGTIGSLTSGSGNDTITMDGGSVTGAVSTGNGTNSLTINNTSSSIGSYTGGSGVDTIDSKGGDINGNVSTAAAADSVTISDGGIISGDVTLGSNSDSSSDADALTVTGTNSSSPSVISGSITTGSGADTVSFTDATIGGASKTLSLGSDSNNLDGNDSLSGSNAAITATITTGSGADSISLTSGSTITGSVTLGADGDGKTASNADTLSLDASTIAGAVSTGSGADTVTLSAASSISGNVTLGIDGDTAAGSNGDTLTLNASTITGNVSTGSGADAVSVLTTSTITGDLTLGGNTDVQDGGDTLTLTGSSSSSKSVVTGNITTGGGADTVTLTDASIGVDGGSVETLSLGTDSNSNDGNDSLTATRATITADVSTGSGADSITLNSSSSITGTVTLGIDGDTTNGNGDTLTLNASTITGNVSTGSGADAVSVLTTSTITGDLTLGANNDSADGIDTLIVTGTSSISKSVITGSIASGAAADSFTFTNATIGGSGETLSLGSDSNNLDGNDSLSGSNAAITATITTGSGADSISLTTGSTITGSVTLGIDGDTAAGSNADTLTLDASTITGNISTGSDDDEVSLNSGSTITGNVDLGAENDILQLGSGSVSITGNVSLGDGSGDQITYEDNSGPITFTVNTISADSIGTATSDANRASLISGITSGYEQVIGSDAVGTGLTTGDVFIDYTGSSLAILTSTGGGTLDNLDFAAFENLRLGSGDDTLQFDDGSLAGRADGGGVDNATSYSYGILTGGIYTDTGTDLLDYRYYNAAVTVDLSKNQATGVYSGADGGLIDSTGAEGVTTTTNSSFENVFGSAFDDSISGDNQNNLLRGYGANDTILGLAGDDTIDGGDDTSGPDGADVIAGGDGADLILGSDGDDFISGGGYVFEGSYFAVPDDSIDTLSYADENEGLDISLEGTDTGTVLADAGASLTASTLTGTYNGDGAQTITVPTNQTSTDWTDTYGDIQNLVLTSQNDIVRIDSTDLNTGSIDAGGGAYDTLDYSTFDASSPVIVNLSGSKYSFDFDANDVIDTSIGEITISNAKSATNINLSEADSQGGVDGVNNFEVVIGGAADDAIVGNDSANILVGNDGSDRIAGLGGDDTIYGGKGDDYIIPGDGTDYVNAGEGINTILITSQDFAENDVFAVDPNGINIFKLNGDGGSDTSVILAPGSTSEAAPWDPGDQGIDLLDGGDPVLVGDVAVFDTIEGTSNPDYYQFGTTAFKNIQSVDLGAGDDSVGTAPTSKGIIVDYDGGTGSDNITLTLTFQQFARLNQSGLYVADVQNYIDDPTGKEFSSNQADFTASNFESGGVQVVIPAVYNSLQGDPAAITFNSSVALQDVTASSGDDLALSATALTSSTATASSTEDLVSAFVQANTVKGADAVSLNSGGDLAGVASASQTANASAITVDDRSDAVLSAYGLGVDRSTITAGGDISLALSGTVKADTIAQAGTSVVNANGTAEAAGSRDSSLSAGDALDATAEASVSQTVTAAVVDGLAVAGLASRTYGIDDANLTDAATDSVQAGSSLTLDASATSNNRVTASGVGSQAMGPVTLLSTVSNPDRVTLPSSLWGAAFPLINGDRIRFSSTPTGGSVQADRDYYVFNVIPISGEFQISSTPDGDPIDLDPSTGITLQAFRPAVSTADAISTVTAVDLNRSAGSGGGLQAGQTLNLEANAYDGVRATATSVDGEATAGLNRLGGLDDLNTQPISSVVALSNTTSLSGSDAAIEAIAGQSATLLANTTSGDALAEANVQVLASDRSASTAGGDLDLQASANLSVVAQATTTDGRAETRSGAGAGAGSSTGSVSGVSGNALPDGGTYALSTAVRDASQSAGADLDLAANATLELTATASTTGGSRSLGSLWSNGSNVLSTFNPAATGLGATPSLIGPQFLADGQRVQLPAGNSLGLTPDTDYVVRLLASESVDSSDSGATANTITMPSGITYTAGDAIRFRLNSTTPANSSASRYGIALGTTYYVRDVVGSSFRLATAPGGPAIDLLPDSVGLADQLVDADRFQLLVPPSTPIGSYSVATLAANQSGVTLELPAEAAAYAGSRQAGITLADPSALNLAQLNAVDGSGLARGGLMSLLSGASSTITAFADGVLNALSRNVGSDATASAGLLAEGIRDTAITAGSDGTVNTRATINALAEASTTGDNALLDNGLANLNVSATGLSASDADQDITIGGAGDVQSTASLSGRSTASTVLGDSDALAALKATGLESLSNGFTATIGQQGDISAAASIGSLAAPLIISALSSAEGDATAQAAAAASGILGSYDATAPAGFSSLQAGVSQGDISGTASADLQLSAIATNGAASVTLADVSGSGRASITGIENMALTAGAGLSSVDATAVGRANLSARSVELDASSQGSTASTGVFSSTVAALPISFAEDGRIAAIAQQSSFAQSVTVNGNATTSLNNTSLGIGNATITIAGDGSLDARALSQLESRSQSVAGDASA